MKTIKNRLLNFLFGGVFVLTKVIVHAATSAYYDVKGTYGVKKHHRK